MRVRAKLAVLPLLAVTLLASCGDDGPSADEKEAARQTTVVREQAAKQAREAQETYDACSAAMQPLLDSLNELQSRLNVGLNYRDYGEKVGDVQVDYDDIESSVDTDDPAQVECLTEVGLPAEKAFNQHLKASNTWDECFEDIDCDNDSITPTLQVNWDKAERQLRKAERGLQQLEP